MTLIKTAELTGVALNWAVAKCEADAGRTSFAISRPDLLVKGLVKPRPYSESWAHGGPIVERESITLSALYAQKNPPAEEYGRGIWGAFIPCGVNSSASAEGHNPLIAAMRCYAAAKLGEVTDVPDSLVGM